MRFLPLLLFFLFLKINPAVAQQSAAARTAQRIDIWYTQWQQGALTQAAYDSCSRMVQRGPKVIGELNWAMAASLQGNILYESGACQTSAALHAKALQIRQRLLGRTDTLSANSMQNLANARYELGFREEALQLYETAWCIKKDSLRLPPEKLIVSGLNLADCYQDMGFTNKALELYNKLLQYRREAPVSPDASTPELLLEIANCYITLKAYRQAEDYAGRAAALYEQLDPTAHQQYRGRAYQRVAMARIMQGRPLFAHEVLQKALTQLQEYPSDAADVWMAMATADRMQGRYADALNSLEMAQQLLEEGALEKKNALLLLKGEYLSAQQQYKQAAATYYQALGQAANPAQRQECLLHLSRLELERGNYAAAQGLLLRVAARQDSATLYVIRMLEGDIALKQGRWEAALATFQQALQIPADADKQLAAEVRRLNVLVVRARQRNTAADWQEAYRYAKANDIHRPINYDVYARAYKTVYRQFGDSYIEAALQCGDTLAAFMRVAREKWKHPNNRTIQGDASIAAPNWDIQGLQAAMREDLSFLEFYESDSALYVFVLDKKRLSARKIAADVATIHRHVVAFFEQCSRPPGGVGSDPAVLMAEGQWLYEQLLAPIKMYLSKRLLIAPDGIIHFLPFDALPISLASKPEYFQDHRFLLHEYTLAYVPGARWYWHKVVQEKRRFRSNARTLLAIAPVFGVPGVDDLEALNFNFPEVDSVERIWGGEILKGQAAQKQAFMDRAQACNILHLATHGSADSEFPAHAYVAFSGQDQKLYAGEFERINLEGTELVVLSACKTALGQLNTGEGVSSIALAFQRAGAGAVLASLWNVDDAMAPGLQTRFYTLLKEGRWKSEALSAAKRQLLQACDRDHAHPYYWAGYLLNGNDKPMRFIPGEARKAWLWVFAAVLLLFIGWRFLKKRSPRRV